jgi:hypothetical protein
MEDPWLNLHLQQLFAEIFYSGKNYLPGCKSSFAACTRQPGFLFPRLVNKIKIYGKDRHAIGIAFKP